MKLRPYQETAVGKIKEEWTRVNRTLLVLPTGTGKTIVFSHLARDIVSAGGRVLIIAHRDELLRQAADKLQRATGLMAAVEKAGETAHDSLCRVTVGSVQTLMAPARQSRFADDHYTHIVVDEAHHALSDSYQSIFGYWENAKVLGVTATPDRGDRRNLGTFFESLAFEYPLPQAIAEGYLSRIRARTIPLAIELGKLDVQAGDFRAAQVGSALEPYIPQIASEIATAAAGRKCLIFAPLCDTAQRIRAAVQAAGLDCFYCSGQDRSEIPAFEAHAPGCAMVNAMLLTEGYDHPPIDAICVLRPTKIRSLYAQMVGRGTRPVDGKDHLLLIDFLWHVDRHQLCRPASLVAESDEVAAKMTAAAEATAGTDDLALDGEALEAAKREVVAEREAALAKKLAEMRAKKAKLVDPLQYAMSIAAEDLADYQPQFPHEMGPPAPKQLEALEKAGLFPGDITCAGMAGKLLERLAQRRALGFATPKQVRCLERFGFKSVGGMQFEAANKLITRIAANGWRVPHGVNREVAA